MMITKCFMAKSQIKTCFHDKMLRLASLDFSVSCRHNRLIHFQVARLAHQNLVATSMGRHRFLDISAIEMPRTNLLMLIKGCVKSRHFKKMTRCLPLPPLPSECMDLTFLRRKLLAPLKPSMCRSTAKTSDYQSMHALLGSRGRAEDIHPVNPAPTSL